MALSVTRYLAVCSRKEVVGAPAGDMEGWWVYEDSSVALRAPRSVAWRTVTLHSSDRVDTLGARCSGYGSRRQRGDRCSRIEIKDDFRYTWNLATANCRQRRNYHVRIPFPG